MHYFKTLSHANKRRVFAWFFFILLIAAAFLGTTGHYLYADKRAEDTYWENYLHESDSYTYAEQQQVRSALSVQVGTHVEQLNEVDIKNSNYTVTLKCWFSWEGNTELSMADCFEIYNGTINQCSLLEEYHENDQHYQLMRINATISKEFWTKRFPLGSYQLRIYIKPTLPISQLVFVPDVTNSTANPKLQIAGFNLTRSAVNLCVIREPGNVDGALHKTSEALAYSEILTALELNRSSWGLYLKCVIALFGTSIWVLLTLFVCANHNVDSLGMIPAVLFGTVSNIMVGANLVPDAMDTGLLEFINLWGIYTIIISAIAIININRIRELEHDPAFARFFGRVLFYTILATTILGHIILPLSAYRF